MKLTTVNFKAATTAALVASVSARPLFLTTPHQGGVVAGKPFNPDDDVLASGAPNLVSVGAATKLVGSIGQTPTGDTRLVKSLNVIATGDRNGDVDRRSVLLDNIVVRKKRINVKKDDDLDAEDEEDPSLVGDLRKRDVGDAKPEDASGHLGKREWKPSASSNRLGPRTDGPGQGGRVWHHQGETSPPPGPGHVGKRFNKSGPEHPDRMGRRTDGPGRGGRIRRDLPDGGDAKRGRRWSRPYQRVTISPNVQDLAVGQD